MVRSPIVLAIDPGSSKCGVAVLDGQRQILARLVIATPELVECARELIVRHGVTEMVIGDRTHNRQVASLLAPVLNGCPLHRVDEHGSTQGARSRYFQENPPRGLRRLLPLGLQTPPCPVDDYAAVLLAERFLKKGAKIEPETA